MAELWGLVQNIRPLQNQQPDKLIWMPHPRGKFTIKTAYAVLRVHHPKTSWAKLFWNGTSIPRQATIAWMAIQDTLMTQDRVVSLNANTSTYHPAPIIQRPSQQYSIIPSMCNQQLYDYYRQAAGTTMYHWNQQQASSSASPIPENCFHLFFECRIAGNIWRQVLDWCGITRKHNNSVKEWKWILRRLTGQSLHKTLIQTALAATIYWIWGERNARIFKKQSRTETQIVQLIIRDVKVKVGTSKATYSDNYWNRFAAHQIGQPMNIECQQQLRVAWTPPPHGWVALNSDGALSQQGTGYAGILRNENGRVLNAFSAGFKTNSILFLEMIAVERGLELAQKLGLNKVMVQTDSMQVARILNELTPPTWRVKSMVMHIGAIMGSFEEVTIQHVFRESNKVAEALATTYPAMDVTIYFAYPMGNVIDNLIASDANGTLYTRL